MKHHHLHGTNKLVTDFYSSASTTVLPGREIDVEIVNFKGKAVERKVVKHMKLPTKVALVLHAYNKAVPPGTRDIAMTLTGCDLTPSLKDLPRCNRLIKRAFLMQPPDRPVAPIKIERSGAEYKAMLQKKVNDQIQKDKDRKGAECPYGCGWTTNQRYFDITTMVIGLKFSIFTIIIPKLHLLI